MKELARESGVSRVTMRNALKSLEADGVLEVRQGLGTFVAGTSAPRPRVQRSTFVEPRTETQNASETEEQSKEPLTLHEIFSGLGLFLFTQCRVAEIAYSEKPTEPNRQRFLEASGRELVLGKLSEAVFAEPENPLLEAGLISTFNKEVSTIAKAPSLGDALVEVK